MSLALAPQADLKDLYRRLHKAYGHQAWWPAEERFEILVGAVLTQNTAWLNVERAIGNLRTRGWLQAEAMLAAPEAELAAAIRSSGYFRIKAQRLRNLCDWFVEAGGFDFLDHMSTNTLRRQLLAVKGIGPETADDILLYAFDRPVFVIDAYTRRLLLRLGWLAGSGKGDPGYEPLRAVFELTLPADAAMFGQYHALIVEHAKQRCRARPLCSECFLKGDCQVGQEQAA